MDQSKKILLYILGCMVFSVGATSFIISGLGADPLDVFSVGIRNTFGLMIGTTQSIFAIICLIIWSSLNRWKFPPITTFLTFFLCGYMIDFGLWLTKNSSVSLPFIEMIVGSIFCLQGSALILMSGFGIRAMDLVAIALSQTTNRPFWLFKGIIELLLLTLGWTLGGIVGLGTVMFLIIVGWGIYPCIRFNSRYLKIPNYGPVK
jgi:uncharacterized protein